MLQYQWSNGKKQEGLSPEYSFAESEQRQTLAPWDWKRHEYFEAMDRVASMVTIHMDMRDQNTLNKFITENSD